MRQRPAPDLLVERTRPIVADLVGSARMGLGTLLTPADPMVITDGCVTGWTPACLYAQLPRLSECAAPPSSTSTAAADFESRTFGGPILEISIENVELEIVAPQVV
jgi:hypothetical protein